MYSQALDAYEQGSKVTTNSRELEAAALLKAAHRIERAQQSWGSSHHDTLLGDALRMNLRLWTFFQVEVARPDSQLPADLRRDLLRLSQFVDRRTFEVMSHPTPERLQALIDINRHVALGLASSQVEA